MTKQLKTRSVFHFFSFFLLTIILFSSLVGCQEKPSAKAVAEQFWLAVQEGKLDDAKALATWDTVEYLKYFSGKNFQLQRYECKTENIINDNLTEIKTDIVIKTQSQNNIRLPLKTVLIKVDGKFRVNLKKTSEKIISSVFNEASNQLGNILQQGLQRLDKELSNSIHDLSNTFNEITNSLQNSIEQGAEKLNDSLQQLENDLKQPRNNPSSVEKPPQEHRI